jgi:hypothetical protein
VCNIISSSDTGANNGADGTTYCSAYRATSAASTSTNASIQFNNTTDIKPVSCSRIKYG